MGKFIRLERRELVWQWRTNTFGEKEWNELKDYYKNHYTTNPYCVEVYDKIKDVSWDEAFDAWVRYDRSEETADEIKIGNRWHYQETLGSFVADEVREQNYQAEIDCEDYADDYEETWEKGDE